MPRRGCSKGKAPTEEPSAREEGEWQGVRTELWSWMHGISHAFDKSGSSGSHEGDPWLRQLGKLHLPTFKGNGSPKESEAWLQRIKKILDSMACLAEHWVRLVVYQLEVMQMSGGSPCGG